MGDTPATAGNFQRCFRIGFLEAPRPKAHRGGGQVCPSRTLSRLLSRKRESSRTHRSTSSRHPPPLLGASGVLLTGIWDFSSWHLKGSWVLVTPRFGNLCGHEGNLLEIPVGTPLTFPWVHRRAPESLPILSWNSSTAWGPSGRL